MSWSLGLTQTGDLALGGNTLAKVTNEQKLVQDLKYELLQKRGSYRYEREYGSTLDEKYIGKVPNSFNEIRLQIESEISEIIRRYQRRQLARAKSDKMSYGAATLTAREVVVDFQIIKFVQNQTAIDIEINLTTASSNPSIYPVKLEINI